MTFRAKKHAYFDFWILRGRPYIVWTKPPPPVSDQRAANHCDGCCGRVFIIVPIHGARSQSADQIQINDLGRGTDFAPVIPDSPSRLSELIIHGQWSEAAELAQDLARRESNDPVI